MSILSYKNLNIQTRKDAALIFIKMCTELEKLKDKTSFDNAPSPD